MCSAASKTSQMPSNHIFMYFDWIFNGFVSKQRPIETVVQPYDFCFFTDLSKLLCKTIFLTIYLASFSFVFQWNTCCGSNSMDDLAQHPYKTVICFRGIECISTDGILLFWIVNLSIFLLMRLLFISISCLYSVSETNMSAVIGLN